MVVRLWLLRVSFLFIVGFILNSFVQNVLYTTLIIAGLVILATPFIINARKRLYSSMTGRRRRIV